MLEINDESLVGYPPVSGDLSKNSFFNFSVFHKYKRTLFGVLNSYFYFSGKNSDYFKKARKYGQITG